MKTLIKSIIKAQHILIDIATYLIAGGFPYIVATHLMRNETPFYITMMWVYMCFTCGVGTSSIAIFIKNKLN